jgi:hypothetical protein
LVDEGTWTPRDHEVARWYSWLMAAGYGFLTLLAVTVMAPAAIRITGIALRKLGTDHSFVNVIDVLAFLLLNFSEFILVGFLAVRSRRRRAESPADPSGSLPVSESPAASVAAGASAS